MVAESEQFYQPEDFLIHKHELLLFSCAINSTSKQYVQYAICLSSYTQSIWPINNNEMFFFLLYVEDGKKDTYICLLVSVGL